MTGGRSPADPFGTAALRAGVLRAWRDSPTRLREDTNSEADLVAGGYRDRVLTELAQNAADAATRAGVPGTLTVRLVGRTLRVANTGAPLDAAGVAALAALRASGKTSGVGRFGVGFTAVLAVSDAPEVRSRSGSVVFSRERTAAAIGAPGPALRLVWPGPDGPEVGDTEVVLPLRAGVDGAALLAGFGEQAVELLLELTGLARIEVDGHVLVREESSLGRGLDEVRVGGRTWWQSSAGTHRWLVERTGDGVLRRGPDVLRAPTRTDEELDLPALLVADLALAPDRRRLRPGTPLDGLAAGYAALAAAVPPEQRTRLVPAPGFPRSAVDDALRAQVRTALREEPWLPAATGDDLSARTAAVLDRTSAELVARLADVVPGLLAAGLSDLVHTAALAALEVPRLGLAGVVEALAGVQREPGWWRGVYAELDALAHDRTDLAELAALPVPLVDGRTVLGPRTTVLTDGTADLPGLRVVHPGAAHPLLVRLGAREAGAAELLAEPALAEAVTHTDPDDPTAAAALAATVLGLVAAARPRPGEHPWLGGLLLPDDTGELRAADELLLPGAPLAAVLDPDAPFGVLAAEVLAEHGPDVLRAVGLGWGFTVLVDDEPTAADHDLDDEPDWWAASAPSRVRAVRDLDLVDPARWPAALALLHADPDTLAAVREPGGHTGWWLRRHAELDGVRLGHWRAPGDGPLAGLLDVVPVPVDPGLLAAGEVGSAELARLLLERLADPARRPSAAVVARAHAALAAAVDDGTLELDELEPPGAVRATSGAVVAAGDALVLDQAWLAQVVPADRLVLGALDDTVGALAELLDAGLASEEVDAEVVGGGVPQEWAADPDVVLACAQRGVAVPGGVVLRHDELRVAGVEHPVAWWVDGRGVHAGPDGLAPALAHVLG